MNQQDIRGVVVPFPKQRLVRRLRVQPPPLKRVRMGAELHAFIEGMARKEVCR
jgi:hypothetical protein